MIKTTVWIVGQWRDEKPWEIQGIFSTEEKAIKACKTRNYFYGSQILDEELPDETIKWDDCKYPIAESEETEKVTKEELLKSGQVGSVFNSKIRGNQ